MGRNNFTGFLFAPADTITEPAGTSINDMIDEMASDDGKTPDDKSNEEDLLKKEKEDKEPKDKKEEKEEKEEEIELDEEPEDLEPVSDFRRKDFLKKYPEAFKEFPELEKSFYREKKYAEFFPTIEDAKEATEKLENYDKFESSVLSGDLDVIMATAKQSDQRAFNKMVDNYLPMLGKVDQAAYFHVIGDVIKNTITAMVREGGRLENDDLKAAGVILNQFVFGKSEFEQPKSFGPSKPDDKETELSTERQQFVQERFESVLEDLSSASNNIIKSTISKHIDPKDVMTSYVRNTAIKEALAEVEESISSDTRFKAILDKLWEKAFKSNFNRSSLDDIKKAHLNKAKTLLPSIIQKHRNEALRGSGKRINDEKEEPTRKGPISVGKTSSNSSEKSSKEIPKGMRSIDFLMQED